MGENAEIPDESLCQPREICCNKKQMEQEKTLLLSPAAAALPDISPALLRHHSCSLQRRVVRDKLDTRRCCGSGPGRPVGSVAGLAGECPQCKAAQLAPTSDSAVRQLPMCCAVLYSLLSHSNVNHVSLRFQFMADIKRYTMYLFWSAIWSALRIYLIFYGQPLENLIVNFDLFVVQTGQKVEAMFLFWSATN